MVLLLYINVYVQKQYFDGFNNIIYIFFLIMLKMNNKDVG